MSSSSTQPGGNILTWDLFRNKQAILNGFEIVGIHVFNKGTSAFLYDKNDCLYAFGASTPCFECGQAALRPRIVPLAFSGVKAIATGEEHAVLLDRTGTVYCWGENDHGQFGVGNTHSYLHAKRPRLPTITQISCGQYYTLALDIEHRVFFWGRQFYKYSGIPVRIPTRAIPTLVTFREEDIAIIQICAGSSVATLLDSGGQIYSWGHKECGVDYGYRKGLIKPMGLEFNHRIKHMVNACNRSAFISTEGRLFVSGSAEDGTYYVFTEIIHCGRVVSIAASWHTDLFAVLNAHELVFELRYDEADVLASGTNFKSILDVFRNTRVPTIIPAKEDTIPGIIRYTGQEVSSDEGEDGRWAEVPNRSEGVRVPQSPGSPKPSLGDKDGYVQVAHLFNSEICSDVTIKLSDGNLPAHKVVLYTKSKYFKKLIQETLNDSKEIDMSNWSSESYKCYVKYLYTGNLDMTSDELIPEIYLIADQDANVKIKETCVKTWRERLTKNNVVRLFNSAFNCQLQGFLAECSLLLSQNLPSILVSEDYLKLSETAKLSLALTAALHGRTK